MLEACIRAGTNGDTVAIATRDIPFSCFGKSYSIQRNNAAAILSTRRSRRR